jgi:hypothetical protein
MLVKSTLEAGILALSTTLSTNTDPEQARQDFARQLATLIDTYIKTATVTVTVATTGTAAVQTGTGTGTIS